VQGMKYILYLFLCGDGCVLSISGIGPGLVSISPPRSSNIGICIVFLCIFGCFNWWGAFVCICFCGVVMMVCILGIFYY